MKKVLLIGAGDVGTHLLEFAARDESNIEWVVGDINKQKAQWACNNAEIGAAHHGLNPLFRAVQIDLYFQWIFMKLGGSQDHMLL